jgi:hypothetical protein
MMRKNVIWLAAALATVLAASGAAAAEAELEGVREFLRGFLIEQYDAADLAATRAAIALRDLDGDGADEAIVFVLGPNWCGSGGCNAYVLTPAGDGYRAVMDATVTDTPIGVLPTTSHGWLDLFVSVGGGGVPAGTVAMRFDGTAYPRNPTVAPAEPVDAAGGEVLIAGDARGVVVAQQSEEDVYDAINELHGDADGFFDLFTLVQEAMQFGDPVTIAASAAYPLTVAANGEVYDLLSEDHFLENFDALVMVETQEAVANMDVDELIVTSEGVGLADGAVWVGNLCFDDACSVTRWTIIAVNN